MYLYKVVLLVFTVRRPGHDRMVVRFTTTYAISALSPLML